MVKRSGVCNLAGLANVDMHKRMITAIEPYAWIGQFWPRPFRQPENIAIEMTRWVYIVGPDVEVVETSNEHDECPPRVVSLPQMGLVRENSFGNTSDPNLFDGE